MTDKPYEVATYWVKGRDRPFKSHVSTCTGVFGSEWAGYKLYEVTATSVKEAHELALEMRANDEGFGDRSPVDQVNP